MKVMPLAIVNGPSEIGWMKGMLSSRLRKQKLAGPRRFSASCSRMPSPSAWVMQYSSASSIEPSVV